MREIEFRAWLKKEKKMVKVEEINFTYKEVRFKDYEKPFTKPIEVTISFEDIELMQNTGLKDKNGVKIFEGDIVKFERKNFEVKYSFGRFVIGLNMPISSIRSDCEVIGNIYENKELLGWFE